MSTILVTDGEQRSSLAAVRSLGRAGHRVLVCSADGRSLSGASRYADADVSVPAPMAAPRRFAAEVASVVAEAGVAVVLPASDAAHLALLPRREMLGGAVVPCGDLGAFLALSDKAEMTRRAREVGLTVPRQVRIEEPGQRAEIDLGWPVVVKPTRSVSGTGGRREKQLVQYASGSGELARVLDSLAGHAYPVLLQERVRGDGTGVFLLRWDGELRAVFAHRRLREKPPSGGVSVYRESLAASPSLVEASGRLLASVDWSGLAMVEFKVDGATGEPVLMEVNARMWGSLQLAIDAGVDFPRLLVDAALGAPPSSPPSYREGVRSRWWWGDVDHLLARLGGESGDAPGAADRLRALGDFLVLWRPGDRSEVARADDVRPFLRESAQWLAALVRPGG